jgi:hypothetical protein
MNTPLFDERTRAERCAELEAVETVEAAELCAEMDAAIAAGETEDETSWPTNTTFIVVTAVSVVSALLFGWLSAAIGLAIIVFIWMLHEVISHAVAKGIRNGRQS